MAVSGVVAEAAVAVVVAASVAEAVEDRVMVAVAAAEALSGARGRRFAKETYCESRRPSIG